MQLPGLIKSHIAQLRLAACGGKRGRKSVARRAIARRATLFLSFWGGVGNTFDDFREALQSLLELRYHALT